MWRWLAVAAALYGFGDPQFEAYRPAAFERSLREFHRDVDTPERPAFEALLAAGRFHGLYEEELVTLWRGATRVAEPGERPVRAANRRGAGLL